MPSWLIDYEDDNFKVDIPDRYTSYMKTIPGARHTRNGWRVPATIAGMSALIGTADAGVGKPAITPPAATRMHELQDYHWEMTRAQERETTDPPLYPYQARGVEWLRTSKGALLADDMGLGKTVQTIKAVDHEGAYPAVVVCPKSMQETWAREWALWTDDVTVSVVTGTAAQRRRALEAEAQVYVLTYDTVWRHSRMASFGSAVPTAKEQEPKEIQHINPVTVILDEAHKIKDPQSKRTRGCWGAGEHAIYRIALTGTPVVNSPDDLWSIMRFVSPDEWPSRSRFRERYCLVEYPPWGGVVNSGFDPTREEELRAFLNPRMLRRTKDAVLTQLPPKTYETRYLTLEGDQKKAYTALRDDMLLVLDEQILTAPDPLVLAGRLSMAASATVGEDWSLHLPSVKKDALDEILEEHGPGVVVFAESRRLIDLVSAEYDNVSAVVGEQHPVTRQQNIDDFQAGETDYLFATLGAGAEGITLTRADLLVFLQPPWSNVQRLQAEDRIHRIGQEANAHIITLVTLNTVDEFAIQAQAMKHEQLQRVLKDPAWWKENT